MDVRIWSLPLLSILGFLIYDRNLQELNAYHGLRPIDFDFGAAVLFVIWAGLAASIFPREIRRPSDLFLLFYTLICFLWGSSLWEATGLLSLPQAALLMVLLYLPAFAIQAARRFLSASAREFIFPVYIYERRYLAVPLVGLLLAGAAVALAVFGQGEFGIDSVYERRLAGREALAGHVLAGYLVGMTVNGVMPLLGFIAGWRRSPALLLMAAAYAVLMFWLLGLKSPFPNLAVLTTVGFMLGFARLRGRVVWAIVAGAVLVYGYAVWEIWSDDYSALADYVIRRVTIVQPQVQSYYLAHWSSLDVWGWLLGAPLQGHSDWTYLIGDRYLNNPAANANTNAFLHALLKGGLVAYCVAVAAITALTLTVDALQEQTGKPELIGVWGLFGILISEQAYTVALLSSGIFLCLALMMLFSYPPRRVKQGLIGV